MSKYREHYQPSEDTMPSWLKRALAYATVLCILITVFY